MRDDMVFRFLGVDSRPTLVGRLRRLWRLSATTGEVVTRRAPGVSIVTPDDAREIMRLIHKLERQGLR